MICIGDELGMVDGVGFGIVGGEIRLMKGSMMVCVGGYFVICDGDLCIMNFGNCIGIYVIEFVLGSLVDVSGNVVGNVNLLFDKGVMY